MKNRIFTIVLLLFACSLSAQKFGVSGFECHVKKKVTNFQCSSCPTGTTTMWLNGLEIKRPGQGNDFLQAPIFLSKAKGGNVVLTGNDGTYTEFKKPQGMSFNDINDEICDCNKAVLAGFDPDEDPMNEIQAVTSDDGSITVIPNGIDFDLSVNFPECLDCDPTNENVIEVSITDEDGDGVYDVVITNADGTTVDTTFEIPPSVFVPAFTEGVSIGVHTNGLGDDVEVFIPECLDCDLTNEIQNISSPDASIIVTPNGNDFEITVPSGGGNTSSVSTQVDGDGNTIYTHDDGDPATPSVDWCLGGKLVDHSGATLDLNCNDILFNEDISLTDDTNLNTPNGIGVSGAEFSDSPINGHTTETRIANIVSSNGDNSALWSILSGIANVNAVGGTGSFVTGTANTVDGAFSITGGLLNNMAVGNGTARRGILLMGRANTVSGTAGYSLIGGIANIAAGNSRGSMMVGNTNINEGTFSSIHGTTNQNRPGGGNSLVGGSSNINDGLQNIVHGTLNENYQRQSFVTGGFNIVSSNNVAAFPNGGNTSITAGQRNMQYSQATLMVGEDNIAWDESPRSIISGALNTIKCQDCIVTGQNNDLPFDMRRSAIIGGNDIEPQIIEVDQVYVPHLHIWGGNAAPGNSTGTAGMTGPNAYPGNPTDLLAADPNDEYEVKKVATATLGIGSMRNTKENINPTGDELLEWLKSSEVAYWNYLDDDINHVGVMADDFGKLGLGTSEETISFADQMGVLMGIVKAQQKEIELLKLKINE